MEKLRIIVAENDAVFRKQLKEGLTSAGYIVVGDTGDSASAIRMVRSIEPDVVLVSADLPPSGGLELVNIIEEGRIAAVILMAGYSQRDFVYRPYEKSVVPIIIKPFEQINLLSLIEYSYQAFSRVTGLEQEISRLKTGLEARKAVEKAKGILMKVKGLSEDEAFRRIQQQSMRKRTSMKNIAEAIITTYELSDTI